MIRNSPYKRGLCLTILVSVLFVGTTAFGMSIHLPFRDNFRRHLWNEAGQLSAMVDNEHCGYYGYDGNGNRAYKLTGQSVQDQHNAGAWQYHVEFNDAVLYVNPYFVVTPKGYTKHYYNGAQRIASKIGLISDLPTNIIDTSIVALERIANAQAYMASILGTTEEFSINTGTIADIDGDELDELQWQCLDTNVIVFLVTLHNDTNMLLPVLSKQALQSTNMDGVYYYHADHLGSANWITNDDGTPIEYIHYMPYGELWYNWQASSYNERFKFTGKERDAETGYDYFGARFYSPILLLWLSPDPLSNKYPNISSYAYCGWNPLKYVDPDGKKLVFSEKTTPEFREAFKQAVSYLRQNGLDKFVNNLENSQQTYTIDDVDLGDFTHYNIKERTIHWDPYGGIETQLGKKLSPTTVLNHELDHASQHDSNPKQFRQDANTQDSQYTNKEDKRVITTSEQETARILGEIGETEVTHNDHRGTPYVTKSPITNESY